MKRVIRIHSKAFEVPYDTTAIVSISDGVQRYSWTERYPDGDRASFRLVFDAQTGTATLNRSGTIVSELIFDTARETKGVIRTPYGQFEVGIRTQTVSLPSLLDNSFSISYILDAGGSEESNVFRIELL